MGASRDSPLVLLFVAAMLGGLALWSGRELLESLKTGRFELKYGVVLREREPRWFWAAVMFKTLLIAGFIVIPANLVGTAPAGLHHACRRR